MAKTKTSGLGRGLDSIFVDNASEETGGSRMLRLSDIEPRMDQPRKNFDSEALSQLADSIATHGLIQPIVVRPVEGGFYQIIAGERRWRASKMAGLTEVPVIITDYDDKKTAEAALIENIQREDLNPVEEARALRSLIDDYSMTQEETARRVGRSRPAIANALRLLELPAEVHTLLESGELSAGHARTLLGLTDRDEIIPLANLTIARGLSVRALERLVKSKNEGAEPEEEEAVVPEKIVVDYIGELERRVALHSGRRIKIIARGKKKRIEIPFGDDDDLAEVLKALYGDEILED